MSERSEERELAELESVLRDLRPEREGLDRGVLMYRAGRASARGWGWPLASLGTATLAAVFGTLLLFRPTPAIVEHVVYLPTPETEPERIVPSEKPLVGGSADDAWQRYVRMQEQVLNRGLDGLPQPPTSSHDEPATVESLLNAL